MEKKRFIAAAVACVTAFSCFTACGSDGDGGGSAGDPEDAIRKYVECLADPDMAEDMIELSLPQVAIDKVKDKDEDEYESNVKKTRKTIKNLKVDEAEVTKIKQKEEFSKKQLKYAESYFYSETKSKVKVTVDEGYEYSVKVKYTIGDNKKTETETVCVVNVEDDGWKIINTSLDSLEQYKNIKVPDDDEDEDDDDDDDDDNKKSTKKSSKKNDDDDDDDYDYDDDDYDYDDDDYDYDDDDYDYDDDDYDYDDDDYDFDD